MSLELPEKRDSLDQQFRALFEAAADAMIIVDESGRIAFANEQAEAVFEYPASEMIGNAIGMLVPDRFRRRHRDQCLDFIEGDESRTLMGSRPELRGLRKGEDEFPAEITLAKITDGEDVLTVAIVRDTTERHRAQQALERQAELEDLLRSKDDLIASVSHEIRTPLTSIVGFARLLRDEAANLPASERREMAEILVRQSAELTAIIEDLLAAAKADIGKLEVSRFPVDLRAQAAQVLELWEPAAVERIRILGETVRCLGDPARVRQIIRNLVVNALRYGGPDIRIEVGIKPEGGFVLIADNGPGIPEQDREQIFEAYGRGSDVPGLAPSLGLGLHISRSLAHLMGGELTYRYHEGESTFEVSLPLGEPPGT